MPTKKSPKLTHFLMPIFWLIGSLKRIAMMVVIDGRLTRNSALESVMERSSLIKSKAPLMMAFTAKFVAI